MAVAVQPGNAPKITSPSNIFFFTPKFQTNFKLVTRCVMYFEFTKNSSCDGVEQYFSHNNLISIFSLCNPSYFRGWLINGCTESVDVLYTRIEQVCELVPK